jgi:uncharacterized protein
VTLNLDPRGRLSPEKAEGRVLIASPLTVGKQAGKWCSYGDGPDQPGDQRPDDSGSVVFDTDPLEEPIEILGAPVVTVDVRSNRPVAQIIARLCSVDPQGRSTRVTYGVLNLTHRDSHSDPTPLEPGQTYTVTLQLNEVAQQFPVGHRIRLGCPTPTGRSFGPLPNRSRWNSTAAQPA